MERGIFSKLVSIMLALLFVLSTVAAVNAEEARPSSHKIEIDGVKFEANPYIIGGHNYYQIREICEFLGIEIDFDTETRTVIIKTDQLKGKDAVSMSDWAGTWNSMHLYIDDKELMPTYKARASAELIAGQGNVDTDSLQKKADAIANEIKTRRKCDINSMVIAGNVVHYYDALQDKDNGSNGKLLGKDTYKYEGVAESNGIRFSKFTATNENPLYKNLIALPVETDEPLKHFHFRYANEGFDELLKQSHYPTMIKYDTDRTTLRYAIYAPELKTWNGSWNSFYAYVDDPNVQKSYEEKAAAESQKDSQKPVTAKQVKENIINMFKCDFSGLLIEGNKITMFDQINDREGKNGGKILFSGEYKYFREYPTPYGPFYIFKTEDGKSPYRFVAITMIHQGDAAGLKHFHFLYGNKAEDIDNMFKANRYPAFTYSTVTAGQLAEEFAE
ncbi:MAG: ZinT/AdcA family metal-binding protein [Eubacteriales bacterium]|nr:ZinT/AdcA family metal-binding protein [Eubacteriales bacterium]